MDKIIKALRELQKRVDINTLCDFNKDFEKIIDLINKDRLKKDGVKQ
tara:strand:+ start:76 stop:216 length:141 start_codon:yes stop_codon:yes gene_type:complete